MFQIAFGLVKDTSTAKWWMDILRAFLSLFERLVFTLIPFVYEIFYRIARNTIVSGDLIEEIFVRFQNILGILMIFVLSISILQYIINPDLVTDKVKGAGPIIKKIITVLILLMTIRPLSIPSENVVEGSYNDYLRRDGLLFGTLYSFQNRIIERDFLGRLILGDEQEIKTGDSASLKSYGNELALTILKSSIVKNKEVCGGDTEDFYIYDEATDPNDILDNINKECGIRNKYSFTYFPLIGFIEGAFILVALISFCVDVAIRAIKLAILRIIAPIPIISYASPSSSQNSSFSTWLKELTKTYIDLFIRIAMIFFIILIVKRITQGDLTAFDIEEPTDVFAIIFIIIGLFMFAKNAPQFIYDALGIKKEKGTGIFSGIGKIAAGVGTIGASVAGGIGSARTNREASIDKGSGNFTRRLNTFGGFLGGVGTGLKAGLSAEDHQVDAVIAAQNRRNARAASGSTGLGRTRDRMQTLFTGSSPVDVDEKYISDNKAYSDLYERVAQKADVNGMDKVYGYSYKDATGRTINVAQANAVSVKSLKERFDRLKASGHATTAELETAENNYKAAQEHLITSVMATMRNGNKDANGKYIYSDVIQSTDANGVVINSTFTDEMGSDIKTARTLASKYDLSMGNTGDSFKVSHFDAQNNAYHRENSDEYKQHKADRDYNKK